MLWVLGKADKDEVGEMKAGLVEAGNEDARYEEEKGKGKKEGDEEKELEFVHVGLSYSGRVWPIVRGIGIK